MKKKFTVLGIHDGHDSSCCLTINGKLIYAAQEERFSKIKNDYGFPKHAISSLLKYCKISKKDIDIVALGTNYLNPVLSKLKRNANFSIKNWVEEQELFWKPKIFEKKKISYWNIFKNKNFQHDKYYNYHGIIKSYMSNVEMKEFRKRRIQKIQKFLGIDQSKIKIINHETCHRMYAYYFFPLRKNGICVTAEGIGDYSNGSVSIIKNGDIKEIAHNKENHIGHIYQYITLLLGLKPTHHEFKVMGLAPYASDYEIKKCYDTFGDILQVKNLNIVFKKKPKDLYFHFKDKFKYCRFDGIAGALQKFVENLLNKWFSKISKKTKEKVFYFCGGVAQNIKSGLALAKNKDIKKILIPPAAGDTSISVGAAFAVNYDYCKVNKIKSNKFIVPIKNMYLGNEISNNELENYLKKINKKKFRIIKNYKTKLVAKLIAKGKIVGRCYGRMEFGLRSLGNRSILCDPRFFSNINKINSKIKKRDFWMPFTPTILDKDFKKYCLNPKKLENRFMSMAFNTTKKGQESIPAALHPADYTARPQMIRKIDNKEYYEIINEFKKITGVGALLNTSLNLHGLPVVENVKDAFNVINNSDLDILIINDYMILKN